MPITRMRQTRAAVLLAILLVAPACVTRIDPKLTPQQQEQAQLRQLQRTAQMTERIGVAVASLQQVEITLANAGRIPRETHVAIQTYLKLSAEFVLSELETAKDQTKSPLERQHGLMRALKFIDGLQTNIIDKLPDPQTRTELGLAVLAIQMLLLTMQFAT
jgi:hypothetical protein